MLRPYALLIAAALALLDVGAALAADAARTSTEHPLAPGKLALVGPPGREVRRVSLSARWTSPTGTFNPAASGAALHIAAEPEGGENAMIALAAERWHALSRGRGFRYVDPTRAALGIRTIVIRIRARGGRLRIAGGRIRWHPGSGRPARIRV